MVSGTTSVSGCTLFFTHLLEKRSLGIKTPMGVFSFKASYGNNSERFYIFSGANFVFRNVFV